MVTLMALVATSEMDLRLVRPSVIASEGVEPCTENNPPCTCGNYPDLGLYVVCDGVTVDELRSVLSRTDDSDIFWLQFMPAPSRNGRIFLPPDVLAGKRIRAIDFYCPSPSHQLEIDPDALRSSLHSVEHLYVLDCDLERQSGFEFLAGFDRLAHLYLYGLADMGAALAELPVLPGLLELDVHRCSGIGAFPSQPLPNLRRLDLSDNALDDGQVERILETLRYEPDALQVLSLAYNQLTLVPPSLSSFAQLSDVSLSGNRIPTVQSGQLKLSAPKIERLLLTNTSLYSVEPGALEGSYSVTSLPLLTSLTTDCKPRTSVRS